MFASAFSFPSEHFSAHGNGRTTVSEKRRPTRCIAPRASTTRLGRHSLYLSHVKRDLPFAPQPQRERSHFDCLPRRNLRVALWCVCLSQILTF